jgi:hypothetical protein
MEESCFTLNGAFCACSLTADMVATMDNRTAYVDHEDGAGGGQQNVSRPNPT